MGQAILESYSRILESLAFTVMSRIEDVLYADFVTQNPSQASLRRNPLRNVPQCTTPPERFSTSRELETNGSEMLNSMTLFDFMGWGDQQEAEAKKELAGFSDETFREGEIKHPHMQKIANIVTNKKISYLDNLGGMRSPTARH